MDILKLGLTKVNRAAAEFIVSFAVSATIEIVENAPNNKPADFKAGGGEDARMRWGDCSSGRAGCGCSLRLTRLYRRIPR